MPTRPRRHRTRLRRRLAPLLLATLAASQLAFASTPEVASTGSTGADASRPQAPGGYELTHHWYPSHDGVNLHAAVYLPSDRADDEQHPVLLSITPYTSPNGGATGAGFGAAEQPIRFPELFDHPSFAEGRWAYVAVDVRGFGGSGGCFQYYGPNEFADTKATIDWAGTQDWSTGRVALWGKSYDAAQEVLALGSGSEHLAAAVIQAPGLSGYTALWHNGVHYATGRFATTSVYLADDLFPPASQGSATSPEYALSNVDGAQGRPDCTVDWQGMNLIGDRTDPFWDGKEPYLQAAGSAVPTFWFHGFFDANTKPEFLDIWESLTGPRQAWFGQYTHVRGHEGQVGREGFLDEAFRFMDRHVRGIETDVVDPAVTVQSGGPDGEWRSEAQWPPADAADWTFPLNAGSYVDAPEAVSGGPEGGAGFWSATPELPHDVHLAGQTTLRLRAFTHAPGTQVVVRIYDMDADGTGMMATRTAAALPEAGSNSIEVAFYPQDFRFQEGHRIAVHVSAADDGWYHPGTTNSTVSVEAAELVLPLLTVSRTDATWLLGEASDASASFPVRVDPAVIAAAEVPGAVPPPMR